MNAIRKFMKEEDGVTALEYGLLAAVIAGILVVTVSPKMKSFFTSLFDTLGSKVTTAAKG